MNSDYALQFLEAAHELGVRQSQIVALVAEALGTTPFEYWIHGDNVRDPKLEDIERTKGGQWRFYFHGLEFDASHISDGRNIRVDFSGDGGSAFSPTGVLQFVNHTAPPWRIFPELKQHIAGAVDSDYLRCVQLSKALIERGLVTYVAPHIVDRREPEIRRGEDPVIERGSQLTIVDELNYTLAYNLLITDEGRRLVGKMNTSDKMTRLR